MDAIKKFVTDAFSRALGDFAQHFKVLELEELSTGDPNEFVSFGLQAASDSKHLRKESFYLDVQVELEQGQPQEAIILAGEDGDIELVMDTANLMTMLLAQALAPEQEEDTFKLAKYRLLRNHLEASQ